MRFLVTVLMGFSFECFGGPEAVVDQAEEDARDSGQEEDGRKGGHWVADADAPMLSRAATRAKRAAASKDARAHVACTPLARPAEPACVLGDGGIHAHPEDACASNYLRAEAQTTMPVVANHGSSQGEAELPMNNTPSTRLACAEAACLEGTHSAPGHDREASGLTPKHMLLSGVRQGNDAFASHMRQHRAATTASANSLQPLPCSATGAELPVANNCCNCTADNVQMRQHPGPHISQVDMARCSSAACTAQERTKGCWSQSEAMQQQVALRPASCACTGARNSSDGCSDVMINQRAIDQEFYSEELKAVLSHPSALPVRLRPPPSELVAMSASTTVCIWNLHD